VHSEQVGSDYSDHLTDVDLKLLGVTAHPT
jgi:hypothetical protein